MYLEILSKFETEEKFGIYEIQCENFYKMYNQTKIKNVFILNELGKYLRIKINGL